MSLPVTRQPGNSVYGCTSVCIHVDNNSTLCRLHRHFIEWTVDTCLTARVAETLRQSIPHMSEQSSGPLFVSGSLTQSLFEPSLYYFGLIPTQPCFQFIVNWVCNRLVCLRRGEGLPDQESYVPIFVMKETVVRGSHQYEAEWTLATLLFIFSVLIQQFTARNIECRMITLATLHFLATVKCKNRLTQLPISTNVSIDSFLIDFNNLTLFDTQPLS